jgi:S-(hydroxymethyl)glutathione dehydrogenase/alcohol dehydrogenase
MTEAPAKISRRKLLTGAAQPSTGVAGRPFRGFVVDGDKAGVRSMKLLPVRPREVVIRTEAAPACYSLAVLMRRALDLPPSPGMAATGPSVGGGAPSILGHCAVGTVEQVGDLVRRVKPGDRVIVPGTPYCGQCYECLQGRADWCQYMAAKPAPIAVLDDGREVIPGLNIGGFGEFTVVIEEYCVPVFTKLPAAELAMLGDCAGIGLAAGLNLAPIEPGSDVVVFGCGPLGLGAVQAARIAGATRIIAVEPVRYRREAALKLGATLAIDPNVEGDRLIPRIRELCRGPTDRWASGGRLWDPNTNTGEGADFVIEAVGGDIFAPSVEVGPDPNGVVPLKQALAVTRAAGKVTYLGVMQRGEFAVPPMEITNRGRSIHSGQMGGMNVMRDLPRYVKLAEKGLFDLKSLATMTVPLDRAVDALKAAALRTTIGAVVVF